ncbi:MAG: VOC family protein [Acetobacteraceae bacterium]
MFDPQISAYARLGQLAEALAAGPEGVEAALTPSVLSYPEGHPWRCRRADGAQSLVASEAQRDMQVRHIDHVLLAMPTGREDEARAFYQGMLGIPEVAKPPPLAARGGCWFENGPLKIHLGVDKDFIPARKAHPAFIVADLPRLVARLEQGGYRISDDEPLAGYDRKFVDDPFGNRIELMEPKP